MRTDDVHRFSKCVAELLDGSEYAELLLEAAAALFRCEAGFVVLNRRSAPPVYLADTYCGAEAKAAVQLYVRTTFEINPVHNAIRSGLRQGVYRMSDLAPDNWRVDGEDVIPDTTEEINFRTPGWPRQLQEIAVLVDLGEGTVGEIALARKAVRGGIPNADLAGLTACLPILRPAFAKLISQGFEAQRNEQLSGSSFDQFADDILSPREAEIVRLILQGHSSASIGLRLDIALPTVKTHRRNAYEKLGISTQQELFHAYLVWRKAL